MVALPQSAFPKRHAQSNPRRSCVLSRSLTSVQESSDIGLQGKQQAEEKNGMFVSRSHIECVWCETLHFLSYPIFLFSCNARPTLVRRSLTEIRTPSSSAGSSRSRLCRSDWEILQVRGRHAPNYPQQITHKVHPLNLSPFIFPSAHSHYPHTHISIQLPPLLSPSETINHTRTTWLKASHLFPGSPRNRYAEQLYLGADSLQVWSGGETRDSLPAVQQVRDSAFRWNHSFLKTHRF